MGVDISKGFVGEEIGLGMDLEKEISLLKKQKNAIILAHYYTYGEVQDIADFVGDSLALSQQAASADADIILFAGVRFMGETAKVLAYDKKVLLPDLNAGCSLADSCPADAFKRFIDAHPGHTVISYVNTSVEVKALTDIVCTSSNAVDIINSLPADEKIIFGPDRNLGNYIKRLTGRENMLVWDGACHVHEEFSVEGILELKQEYPEAKVVAHPECKRPVALLADFVGSTAAILSFVQKDDAGTYIVATESGILHQMKKSCPGKLFIPAPSVDVTCGCSDCNFMKLATLKKIYLTLKYEMPEIVLDRELCNRARKPILRMLELSK